MTSKLTDTPHRKQAPLTWGRSAVSHASRPWGLGTLTLSVVTIVIVASFGPWLTIERGPARAREVVELSGVQTDGIFSLVFGLTASLGVVLALLRPAWGMPGWVACIALLLCFVVGLVDWVLFSPMDVATESGAEIVKVEWGLKLLTFAAPVGALLAFMLARHLDD